MAPAWQEIKWRVAQRSLAVMCPACWCSPDGLLALMESANRGLIIRAGSMSQRSARLLSVASDRPTVPSRVIALSQAPALGSVAKPPPCAGKPPAGASQPRRSVLSYLPAPPPRLGSVAAGVARLPMDRHWSVLNAAD